MSIQAPPLTIVRPGEGATGDLGTIGVAFKLWGSDTGGAVSIVRAPVPRGALVPPHLHTREDEYPIVTEGEIGPDNGRSDSRTHSITATRPGQPTCVEGKTR